MKKLFALLVVLFLATVSYCQPPVSTAANPKQGKVTAKKLNEGKPAYACPKCCDITKSEGKCEHCKVDRVKLGTYYCTHCMKSTGDKPGNCDMCKMRTTQISRKYCATHKMKHHDKMKHDDKMMKEEEKGD